MYNQQNVFTGIQDRIMQELPFSKVISFEKAVGTNASYSVNIDKEHFPRLSESCCSVLEPIHADFRFFKDLQGLSTIEGSLKAKVTFICQRCSKEFVKELNCTFSSTCDEQKAKSLKIDQKLDIVELNDDGTFNLLDFLEDCLLLEIPFITSHDEGDIECIENENGWSFGKIVKSSEDNPFAKLQSLKENLKK